MVNVKITAWALLVIGLHSCSSGVPGSGVSRTETRRLPSFDHVTFVGIGSALIAVGDPQSFEITTDDNLLPLIETTVEEGALVIRPKEALAPSAGIIVKIGVPDLRGLTLTGKTVADVQSIDHESFDISISGDCTAMATGATERLSASIQGDGRVRASGLQAKRSEVRITGDGLVAVQTSEELDIMVVGSGTVRYSGDPKIEKNVIGDATIEQIK